MNPIRSLLNAPIVRPAVADARSLVRPHVKRAKGAIKGAINDLHLALSTGKLVDEPLRQQWLRILRNSEDELSNLPPATGPKVLLATAYGFGGAMLAVESIFAMALRMRGANPVSLRCDKVLPACEWNRFGNYSLPVEGFGPELTPRTQVETCRICTEWIENSLGLLPIRESAFTNHLRGDDLQRATRLVDSLSWKDYKTFVYRGVRVGEHALASLMRTTLRGTPVDDAETRFLWRRYLISGILVVDLAERVYDEEQPDCVVAVHGVYVTHGILCEVARNRGISVVVYGIPYRKSTVLLSHGDTYHRTLVTEPTSVWEEMEWTAERAAVIDEYLHSRRFGTKDQISYNGDPVEDRDSLYGELGLDPAKPVISLFTNVIWDAQLYHNYNAFENLLEWLYATVRYFATRPDLQLVVRVHPAEVKGPLSTNQPIAEELAREIPVLPANVKVIPAESRLSSYTLAEVSHAALIYGTKMGMEIAAIGTPLIVAGETLNRGKGYSYDVESPEEYFALLDRVQDLPRNSPEMVERARKYAYHFFYRQMIDLPLYSVRSGVHLASPRLEFSSLAELSPGRSATLDLICRGILDGQTLFVNDDAEAGAAAAVG